MPTHNEDERFVKDYDALTPEEKRLFRLAVKKLVEDLDRSGPIRGSLRVMPMQGYPGVWEMTWEGLDGRATFEYGAERKPGKKHIRWRRVGDHRIFDNP